MQKIKQMEMQVIQPQAIKKNMQKSNLNSAYHKPFATYSYNVFKTSI